MPDPGKILISERVLMLYLKGFFSCGNSETEWNRFSVIDFMLEKENVVLLIRIVYHLPLTRCWVLPSTSLSRQ